VRDFNLSVGDTVLVKLQLCHQHSTKSIVQNPTELATVHFFFTRVFHLRRNKYVNKEDISKPENRPELDSQP
jgi:hypothetical protein